MLMNILQRKGIKSTFLGIKTNGYSLHSTNIVHGGFLIKISQRNMPGFFIDLDGSNRSRDLLDECKLLIPVKFIGVVD